MRKMIVLVGICVLSRVPLFGAEPQLVVADKLAPIPLHAGEIGGEMARRLNNLIYTNHLAIDFQKEFIAPFYERAHNSNDWFYIGAGKMVDVGSIFYGYTHDERVRAKTQELIDGVLKSRDATGYIGYFKPEPGERQNTRNWVLHEQEYLLLGLVEFYRYAGSEAALAEARQLGDYILRTFPLNPNPERVCTAGLPEALLALYAATGDTRYLDFAANQRHGFTGSEIQCESLRTWNVKHLMHVYVGLARCYAQMRLYRFTGEKNLLRMTDYVRHELLKKFGELNITGSASYNEHFTYLQLGSGKMNESCVAAYLIRWFDDQMRLTGDLRFADIIERNVYNALFGAQSPDDKFIRYDTPFTGPRVYFDRNGFCCPPNLKRAMGELPQKVYYRRDDGGIAVALYTPSKVSANGLTLEQVTDYPTSGNVLVNILAAPTEARTLQFRVPRWCPKADIRVNGKTVPSAEINRAWKVGDRVELNFPMPWRLVRGHRMQEGRVALLRGPQLYCVGTAQNANLFKADPNMAFSVVDPAGIGAVEADTSIRPNGTRVKVRAKTLKNKDISVIFTEFPDPSGIVTYFHVLDLDAAVEDELIGNDLQ